MAAWFESYRAYDDDTLTALANAGLLRRAAKDVEAGKVQWAEQGAEGGVVEADGQRVQLDARGPQKAQCDCPAPGICKHILGAALWLRALEPVAGAAAPAAPQATEAPAEPGPTTTADPLAEVKALQAPALFKQAGVAAVRRAVQALPCGIEWRVQGGTLVMELPALNATCRYVAGAGYEGMVSEVPARERKAVHLIALAALREALGEPLAWPEGMAPAAAAELTTAALSERERAFLAHVEAMLHELLTGGLSHVSEQASARLLALNMSARGEGLPRLATLLRNLGGMVDGLVRRDHRMQERDALALMSSIQALCDALRAPASEGANAAERTAALRGRLRRAFDETTALELLPLGGHWWQTLGGARGLTLAFWDLAGQRLLQAVLARPDGSDTAFNRHSAWSIHAVWPGAGPAQSLCQAPLRLENPRLADDDRLALAGTARAQALPPWQAGDARLQAIGSGRWADLTARLSEASGLSGDGAELVLLRPRATRAPVLDEAHQQLLWPVQDDQGQWLHLTVPVGDASMQRVDNLDRLAARGAPVHAVVVHVERTSTTTLLVPLSLLSSDARGQVQAVSLDYANEAARPTPLAQRILRMVQWRKEQAAAPAASQPTLAQRLLGPVLGVLETQAATGRMPLTAAQAEQLQAALTGIASVGLHTVASSLQAHLQSPQPCGALRLQQLCQRTVELDGLPAISA